LTIPRRLKDNPTYLNYRSEAGRCLYGEDVYVGYRYYEKMDIEPLFPFGHGLSYTTFKLSDVRLEETLKVNVKNTGSCAGSEVVQVYVAPVSPFIQRPAKELKGFKKVFLEAGAEKLVDVECDVVRWTSFWDEKKGKWCSQAGMYRILVGTSSAGEFLEASLEVQRTSHWSGL
jgi:beta-glucosidase